jgi:hypothetical protein
MKKADNDNDDSDTWQTVGAVTAKLFLNSDARKFFVEPLMSKEVGGGCILGSGKTSKVSNFSIHPDPRLPSPVGAIFENADEARLRQAREPLVSLVLKGRSLPNIGEPVVGGVSVNMIDEMNRPRPMNIEPRETMSAIPTAVNLNTNPTCTVAAPGDVSDSVLLPMASNAPSEDAGIRTIEQLFAEFFSRDHGSGLTEKKESGTQERDTSEDAEKSTLERLKFVNLRLRELDRFEDRAMGKRRK